MTFFDWFILLAVLAGIILYGMYKSRRDTNLDGYFLGNRSMPWFLVLLGIMGTQASAVTYLSAPGQSYTDGMRFVQYYFGLPFAMIVISIFFVPVFSRLKVITAYEFLQKRFDVKTRTFTSLLFLISRGLSTGISICAPSIVLSSLMGWNIYITNLVMGGLLIIYTITGGARAVAHTQKLQMLIVFITLGLSFYAVLKLLPDGMSLGTAVQSAAEHGKMNTITSGFTVNGFDWKDKYNIWSGLIGGFFLALSYFGTDHSQVGRYISAKDNAESRKGLLLNGLLKIPMQYIILLLGILVFVFYLNHKAPVYFDEIRREQAMQTKYAPILAETERKYEEAKLLQNDTLMNQYRAQYLRQMKEVFPGRDPSDTNFIFVRFAKDHFPAGLLGLFFAVLFLSGWGSIAAALNALAACSMVDIHQQFFSKKEDAASQVKASKWYTLGWGVFCLVIAMFATNIGNSLIEAVNILGSLFYGVMLGIFLVAFWLKKIGGTAVFSAAVVSEILVIVIYNADVISFLWLNAIGALLVILLSITFQLFVKDKKYN